MIFALAFWKCFTSQVAVATYENLALFGLKLDLNIGLFLWRYSLTRANTTSFLRSVDHTQLDTHTTHDRTPLNKWSARRRDHYLHNTQQTQETNIHALCMIRTRNPSNQAASYLRLRLHRPPRSDISLNRSRQLAKKGYIHPAQSTNNFSQR
jgi:hypothetical protein